MVSVQTVSRCAQLLVFKQGAWEFVVCSQLRGALWEAPPASFARPRIAAHGDRSKGGLMTAPKMEDCLEHNIRINDKEFHI